MVDGSSVGAVTTYEFTNVTANHTIAASFAIDVPCNEYLKSAIIKLTWYKVGSSDSSMIRTNKKPELNSPTFSGELVNVHHPSGEITFSVNLTVPYNVGSSTWILTMKAVPDRVLKQGFFNVEIYLNNVLFVTVPMDAQGKVGHAEIVFVASDTVMTNNCEESMVIDVTNIATVEIYEL